MLKLRHNKALLLFLITVFLTVQWSAVHIHLAEHHDHNGNHHQHSIQTHAHETSAHHADSITTKHVTDDFKVVELDNDCTSSGWKKTGNQPVILISIAYQLAYVPEFSNIQLSDKASNKQSYITYSIIRLRAPPQVS